MSNKLVWAIVGFSFIIFLGLVTLTSYNRAVSFEEKIFNAGSDIEVQQQRKFDLITKLVDVVEANSQYESSTLKAVTEMRKALSVGDVAQVQTLLNAVAEQYPQLKATEGYTQLMTELSVTENLISEYRKSFNTSVQNYHRLTRNPLAKLLLKISGYSTISVEYLTFDNNELPSELFGN